MRNRIVILAASLLAGILVAAVASAGQHCGRCGGTAAGTTTPCGDHGCGPRWCGPEHRQDPCDGCVHWAGCNGARPGPDLVTPWQLPPGRGFVPASDLGYQPPIGVCGEGGPCESCRDAAPFHCCRWLCPLSWF